MKIFFYIFCIGLIFLPGAVFALTPNDTHFSEQWYLHQVQAEDAWEITQGDDEIIVAVIDASVDLTHPDLDANIWKNLDEIPGNGIDDDANDYIDDINGWDYIDDDNDPSPDFSGAFMEEGVSHGTAVASIIAAEGNNSLGMAGVCWNCKIMPLRVLDSTGNGYSDYVADAIYYAMRNGADIINLSFVGFNWSDEMNTAIKRAWEAGLVVVAASGNTPDVYGGSNLNEYDEYPVCTDQYEENVWVLGVAATDTLDQKAHFSNYGAMCIDISAPGLDILSARTFNPEYYGYDNFYNDDWSGTSFAAPIVSGVAGLVKSFSPGLSAHEINDLLILSGDNIDEINPDYVGDLGTRVNALAALETAKLFAENGSVFALGSPAGYEPNVFKLGRNGDIKKIFKAFENYWQGFDAAIGDLNNNGFEELVVSAGPGGGPQVRIFSQEGKLVGQFFAYDALFRGGVSVALGDVNGDGAKEIITSPGPGGGPHILVYNDHAEIKGNFMAHDVDYRRGVKVAAGDVDGDSDDEIITLIQELDDTLIKTFRRSGTLVGEFNLGKKIDKAIIEAQDLDGDGAEEILVLYEGGAVNYLESYTMEGVLLDSMNFQSGEELFDLKAYYDYISGESRIVLAEKSWKKLILKYIDYRLDIINEINIDI